MTDAIWNALPWFLQLTALLVTTVLLNSVVYRLYKNPQARYLHVNFLRTPASSILSVVALLLPILVSIATYFYVKQPQSRITFLIGSIILLFLVVFLSIWENFSLLRIGSGDETIHLVFPRDTKFISGIAIMYWWFILSLLYLVIFVLFELRSPAPEPRASPGLTGGVHYLAKPPVSISTPRDSILTLWGTPARTDSTGRILSYVTPVSSLSLTFSRSGALEKITEERR